MTEHGRPIVEAAQRLRHALEQTAGALTAADLSALLRGEAGLEQALRSVPPHDRLAAEDRERLRTELAGVQRALVRCRSLGTVLLDIVRLSLEAQGRVPGYGRPGTAVPPPAARHSVNATG